MFVHAVAAGGVGWGLFTPPFIHLLESSTLSNLFLKRKVNALTSKLKTYFGGVGGRTSVVVWGRRRRERKRRR